MNTMTPRQQEMAAAALSRAQNSESLANYGAIIQGFMEKGIPADDIRPRENVLTYHAWHAQGRQVRKGEHGVRITTWIPIGNDEAEDPDKARRLRPKTAVVFHVSQTDSRQ